MVLGHTECRFASRWDVKLIIRRSLTSFVQWWVLWFWNFVMITQPARCLGVLMRTSSCISEILYTLTEVFYSNWGFFLLWLIIFLTWLRFFLPWLRFFCAFFLSSKANARVKLAETGHGPHSSTLVVTCVVRLLFVLFCVLFVCKCVLPLGDNPIAVNKYIIYHTLSNTLHLHSWPECTEWVHLRVL